MQETAYVWGALLCNGYACLPTDKQRLLHCQDPQAENKGTGFTGSFILPEFQQERGDALSLQVNEAAIVKKPALLMTSTKLYFYGKANASGAAGRTGFPQLLQTHSIKQELQLQSILCFPSAEDSCSAIPTTMGLPGAVSVPGGSIHPHEGGSHSATGRN